MSFENGNKDCVKFYLFFSCTWGVVAFMGQRPWVWPISENTTLDVTTVLRLPLWWGMWTNKTRKKYLNKMKWQKRKKENKNSICPRMLLFMQSELFRETFTSLLLTFTSFTCSANWNPPVSLPRGHQKWWMMAWGIILSVQFFHSGSSIPIFKDMELSQRSQI